MSAQVVPLRHERTLDELAATFHREHEQTVQAAVRTVEHAIAAGEALLEAKEKVPHGQWQRWMADNILGPGRQLSMVNAYMHLTDSGRAALDEEEQR